MYTLTFHWLKSATVVPLQIHTTTNAKIARDKARPIVATAICDLSAGLGAILHLIWMQRYRYLYLPSSKFLTEQGMRHTLGINGKLESRVDLKILFRWATDPVVSFVFASTNVNKTNVFS